MAVREWLVSLLVAVFLVLKAAESVLGVEAWPLSSVGMFHEARPSHLTPARLRLLATRGDGEVEMHAHHFALSNDEFRAALFPDRGAAARCQALVDAWNAAHPGRASFVRVARVAVEPIARPGIAPRVQAYDVPCTWQPE